MNRKLILHIGFPKTGTTALQSWFNNNNTLENQLGIRYHPSFKFNGGGHHKIAMLAKSQSWDIIKNNFLSNKHAKDNSIDLVSSEKLMSLNSEEIKNLYKLLYEFYDEIQVYITVRTALSMIKSVYGQQVREGFMHMDLKKFSERALKHARWSDYKETLSDWSLPNKNKENSVHIRIIEKNIPNHNGDSIQNFIDLFVTKKNFSLDPKSINSSIANSSLSSAQIEFLRLMSSYLPKLWKKNVDPGLRRFVYFCFSKADPEFRKLKNFEHLNTQQHLIELSKHLLYRKEAIYRFSKNYDVILPSPEMITDFYKANIQRLYMQKNLISSSDSKYKISNNQMASINDIIRFYETHNIQNLGPSEQYNQYINS